ncbi:MAG: PqqD family protein [Caldilineaceae bacterium]|nr:PqqD family protein [Caldilineaceae bacterium]
MITLQTIAQPHVEVIATPLQDDETILLHLQTQRYYTLNVTGSQIWQGIREGLCAAEISSRLVARYEVTPAQAEEVTLALFQELAAEALIEPSPV